MQGRAQNPFAQFREKVVPLQHIHKFLRRYRSVFIVFPANQGFRTGYPLGIRVHDRLVTEEEPLAVVHNAVADYVQAFNGETFVFADTVLKYIELTQMVNLGFVIGKTEARIDRFHGHVETFQVDGASNKRKYHVVTVHHKVVNTVVLYPLVQVLQVSRSGVLAHDGKLGSVHAVPLPHAEGFLLNHLGKFLQHTIAKSVTVNFV